MEEEGELDLGKFGKVLLCEFVRKESVRELLFPQFMKKA